MPVKCDDKFDNKNIFEWFLYCSQNYYENALAVLSTIYFLELQNMIMYGYLISYLYAYPIWLNPRGINRSGVMSAPSGK